MGLIRKVVTLEATEDVILDYNYHYELMKELYKALELTDSVLAFQTHEEGSRVNKKKYKLFNHQLFLEEYKCCDSGMKIKKGSQCKLTISGVDKIVTPMALGVVRKGSVELFGKHYSVVDIESGNRVKFDTVSLYKVRNPIVATIQDADKRIVYASPFQEDFYRVLANNLKRKYEAVYGKEYKGELYFDIEDTLSVKKRLISNIKTTGKLIGYSGFELYLVADKDMQQVAYYCGFGSNNSMGMGMVTHITSRRG